jgi:hypothetical protein
MKNIILLLLLSFVPTVQLFAQKAQPDSVTIKIELAKADARHFRPNKQIRTARKNRLLLNSSDYFMPTANTVSNSKLLTDSVYVKAFKDAAYNRSIHNGKTSYYAVVSAEIIGGALVAGALLILAFKALFGNINIY